MKSPFAATSRYASIATTQLVRPDGTVVAFLRRRVVPDPSEFATLVVHQVAAGERLDNITAVYIDDPEQFWRLCDANRALRPAELTETVGETINITLPQGIAGPRRA